MNPIHMLNYSLKKSSLHLLLLLLLIPSCKNSESKKQNLIREHVFRLHDEYFFTPPAATLNKRSPYPWETKYIGTHHRITKEFFHCKGNSHNPVIVQNREKKEPLYYRDCLGGKKHGLPLRNENEFIYPCLIDILNYIQEKSGKRVVITTGHRCPQHNAYADPCPQNWGSKHMLGAEVDFYVEEMEENPDAVIALIQQFYKEVNSYKGKEEYEKFIRYEAVSPNTVTPPWYNKEVFIKLYLTHEGRDYDNQHPFPYIGLEVRYDRELGEKVVFDQAKVQNYLRY